MSVSMSGCVYVSSMWVSMVARKGVISSGVGNTGDCEPLNVGNLKLRSSGRRENISELSLTIHS